MSKTLRSSTMVDTKQNEMPKGSMCSSVPLPQLLLNFFSAYSYLMNDLEA